MRKNFDAHTATRQESLRDIEPKQPKKSDFESTMWFRAVMLLAILVAIGSLVEPDPNPPTHPYSKYRT